MTNEGTERPEGPFDPPPVDSAPPPSFADAGAPPPPRPPSWSVPPSAPVRRLVRDPGASLGGVASGLSQHYGIDVSVIRLAFVLFTLISGVGLLLYLLAWLIIPKGDVWPPAGAKSVSTPLSSRELAIGAILVGLAMIVFVSGGSVGEVLVPLLLVGGGVWLLNQSQSPTRNAAATTAAGPWPPPTGGQPQDTVVGAAFAADPMTQNAAGQAGVGAPGVPLGDPYDPTYGAGYGTPPGAAYGTGAPAQPPRRRRPLRAIFIGILALIGGFIAILIVGIIALLVFGDVNFEADAVEQYTPQTVSEIPEAVQLDAGEIVLDFSALDAADFDDLDTPINLDVELDAGEVRIVIPEDLAIDLDAAANLGDVDVFDRNEDGISPRITVTDDDPDLRLDVNVGLGAVVIERP